MCFPTNIGRHTRTRSSPSSSPNPLRQHQITRLIERARVLARCRFIPTNQSFNHYSGVLIALCLLLCAMWNRYRIIMLARDLAVRECVCVCACMCPQMGGVHFKFTSRRLVGRFTAIYSKSFNHNTYATSQTVADDSADRWNGLFTQLCRYAAALRVLSPWFHPRGMCAALATHTHTYSNIMTIISLSRHLDMRFVAMWRCGVPTVLCVYSLKWYCAVCCLNKNLRAW